MTRGQRLAVVGAWVGWAGLWLALGSRFGWWLVPAGCSLGLLLAGLGVIARDALAGWVVAYFRASAGSEGSPPSASKP